MQFPATFGQKVMAVCCYCYGTCDFGGSGELSTLINPALYEDLKMRIRQSTLTVENGLPCTLSRYFKTIHQSFELFILNDFVEICPIDVDAING